MTTDPINNLVSEQVNKQLLKYAVSRHMFCPLKPCGGKVLDMRRAVLATIRTPDGQEQTILACVSCWDHYRNNIEKLAVARDLKIEVLDGRILWKQPAAKAPAKAKTKKAAIDLERVMAAAEEGDGVGFCRACGHEQDGCEPDARKRACEACGANEVYGAEELVIMLG